MTTFAGFGFFEESVDFFLAEKADATLRLAWFLNFGDGVVMHPSPLLGCDGEEAREGGEVALDGGGRALFVANGDFGKHAIANFGDHIRCNGMEGIGAKFVCPKE